MDLITIFQISLGVSLFGIVFILIRNLPLIPEYKVKYVPRERRISFKIKRNVSEGRMKTVHKTQKIQEKIGHRLRAFVLKIDNFLFNHLQRIKERKSHLENIYFAEKDKKEDSLDKKIKEKKQKSKKAKKG